MTADRESYEEKKADICNFLSFCLVVFWGIWILIKKIKGE